MTDKDSTTTELNPSMSKDLPNAEQIECVLYDIASMAESLKIICDAAIQGDKSGLLTSAAEHLASKIGWTADRCLGFQVNSSDDWLMPPIWNQKADKVGIDQI
ncbi:MAG: hypothetical protein H0X02_06155 [Nitrosomonas sp.]|nr:hypothetical protein [Nitrosomonas sp.]